MTGTGRTEPPAGSGRGRGEPPRRSRDSRLDEVFGDVLPETTSDERDPRPEGSASDDWHLENRPPHHGG